MIGPRVHGLGRAGHGLLLSGEGRLGMFVHGELSWKGLTLPPSTGG
jgi:hypothetical protein